MSPACGLFPSPETLGYRAAFTTSLFSPRWLVFDRQSLAQGPQVGGLQFPVCQVAILGGASVNLPVMLDWPQPLVLAWQEDRLEAWEKEAMAPALSSPPPFTGFQNASAPLHCEAECPCRNPTHRKTDVLLLVSAPQHFPSPTPPCKSHAYPESAVNCFSRQGSISCITPINAPKEMPAHVSESPPTRTCPDINRNPPAFLTLLCFAPLASLRFDSEST